jgi:hypothetical protein
LTETAYYDAADHLLTGPAGYAKASFVHYADGRVEYYQFGPDGHSVFNPLVGYAIRKSDPRRRGAIIAQSYHGPDGALITGPEGFAELRYRWDDNGKLLSAAWFGPNGEPVIGPYGVHRMELTPGVPSSTTTYFDVQNRELPSLDPNALIFPIIIAKISGIKQPAAKAGLQAGDILWRYGNWSFPNALIAEQMKGATHDVIFNAVWQTFLTERDRLSAEPAAMIVIRSGKPVTLTMPPLPDKTFGMSVGPLMVPVATFAEWQAIAAEKSGDMGSGGTQEREGAGAWSMPLH